MRRAAALLPLLALLWVDAEEPARPEEAPRGYAGSDSCAACHKEIHERWERTAHARSVRPFASGAAGKPFSGEIFESRGTARTVGPGASMECEAPGGGMARFPVADVIGVRRVQMFTTPLEKGRIQVLPVFLEVPKQRWFDYADFIFGMPRDFRIPPDSANSWYTFARNFNSRCGECHMTDYRVGYDPDAGSYDTRWSEPNTGCESCHGPGDAHARKWRTMEKGPDPIVNPSRLPIDRANMVCGYCHAERAEVKTGFRPGDDLFDFCDVNGLEDEKHLHPDGRARELIHNFVPILESRCGPIRCTKCHDPHGRGAPGDLHRPLHDDRMCTQCHEAIGAEPEAHTRHAADSAGSRCVECHMPPLQIEGGHGWIRDHTISIPSHENTRRFGTPNACRQCHLDREPNFEKEFLDSWYPGVEERNHRVRLAEAVGLGRAGDARGREAAEALAKEGNPVYRAAAVWTLSRYGGGATAAAAAGDPHPMVRRAAVKSLAAADPAALEALLADPAASVRYAAAMALAERYDHLRTRPGLSARLLAMLGEFAAHRPDTARTHFAIGALHDLRLEKAEARRSYLRYLTLQPWDDKVRRAAEAIPTPGGDAPGGG